MIVYLKIKGRKTQRSPVSKHQLFCVQTKWMDLPISSNRLRLGKRRFDIG
jgi:hypothetical protein